MRSAAYSFALFAVVLTSTPFPANSEGLSEVLAIAMQNDAQILAAEENYQATMQARPIARAALLPQVSVQAETSDNRQETDGATFGIAGRDVDFNTHGYSINLSQALYHHDFYVQLRQSKNTVAQAHVELDAARQDLILRVADAYFNVLAAQDNLRFAQSETKAIGRQLEQAETRFEVGLAAITDVKEAQSSYDRSLASEIEAETALHIAIDALTTITGERIDHYQPVSDRMQLLSPEPNDVDAWVDTALDQNLSLLISEYDTKIAKQEVKLQQARHLPTLDIVASYSDFDTGGLSGSRESQDSRIGIELNLPIFEGGRAVYRTKEASHLHRASIHERERIRRETIRGTRDSFFNMVSGISRVHAFARAVESAEVAAEASQAGFEVGTRTSVDVLLALRTVFEAKRDHARSRYDYLLNSLRLKQAAGILKTDDVSAIDSWLN